MWDIDGRYGPPRNPRLSRAASQQHNWIRGSLPVQPPRESPLCEEPQSTRPFSQTTHRPWNPMGRSVGVPSLEASDHDQGRISLIAGGGGPPSFGSLSARTAADYERYTRRALARQTTSVRLARKKAPEDG